MANMLSRIGVLAAAGAVAVAGFFATASDANASSAAPACGNTSLAVTHTPSEGATGHASFVLLFRNVGAQACTLYAYPGLDALDSIGRVQAHAQRTPSGFAGGAPKTLVTIPRGGYASAVVEWMDFNPVTSGACAFSTFVATTPPNTFDTVRLRVSVSNCDLQIHPVAAGTNGNVRFAAAQLAWEGGAHHAMALQGLYWDQAVAALKLDGAEYLTEINELRQLISLPDSDQTPAQNAVFHHDLNALNAFFGTQGLYN